VVDERAFTAALARFFTAGNGVAIGIGDDAAVVRNRGRDAVVCCDPVVEGVHFTRSAPPRLVGRKAVNSNLSDLAAMGALPDWLLVSLVLPRRWPGEACRQLLRGIRDAARAGGCEVVGGDVAAHGGPLVVTVTAIGHLPGRALPRAGAQAGDSLHVTGPLGGAAAGHHLRCRPALREGVWLARQSAVHAAIDVSDGLLLDLATMLRACGGSGSRKRGAAGRSSRGLGAEIDAAALPIRPAAKRLAGGDRAGALRRALGDGEDHVLLWSQAASASLPRGGPLTRTARRPIGRVLPQPGLWLVEEGRRRPVSALGFRHEFGSP
jgi:thiamine-monophosphate kinase